jgi:transcriptional regulator with PAS, ATPase and Fis domain
MTSRWLSNLKIDEVTSQNAAMRRCLELARLAARSDVPVLILGRTGTGKTLLAQAIHNSSSRARGPFISFNASAMSDTLLESQLFGHERGAFTGAQHAVKGKFELADGGTLFFDEIADMSSLAQAKILRAIEYGEFERVGGERMLRSNARIISATNCSVRERIREGRFREDLYHRLDGLVLLVPPLRERVEDLPSLIAAELKAAAAEVGKRITSIHPTAMEMLLEYEWPGNLRELHHTMRAVTLFAEGKVVLPEHVVFQRDLAPEVAVSEPMQVTALSASKSSEAAADQSLESAIREHVRRVYDGTGRNQRKTARILGISRGKLARHLEQLDSK